MSKKTPMYVWRISLDEKWTYNDGWSDTEVRDFRIASTTAEAAIEKAKKISLAQSFEDDGRVERVVEVRLFGIENVDELDG